MSEFETTIHQGIDLSAFYVLHLLLPYGRVILQTFSPGILTGHSGWEGNVRLIKTANKRVLHGAQTQHTLPGLIQANEIISVLSTLKAKLA